LNTNVIASKGQHLASSPVPPLVLIVICHRRGGAVNVHRRIVEAFNRHDFEGAFAAYGPDAVWDMSPMGMGVFEGREAVLGFFEDWLDPYEDFEQVMEEFHDLGGVTFGVLLQHARPRGSSGVVALHYAVVGTWRDGLVERFTLYSDIDEARAVAERLAEERP
jgi:ketosteroid isomerase-like protein